MICLDCGHPAVTSTPQPLCQAHAEAFYQGLVTTGAALHRERDETPLTARIAGTTRCHTCGHAFAYASPSTRRVPVHCPACWSIFAKRAATHRQVKAALRRQEAAA